MRFQGLTKGLPLAGISFSLLCFALSAAATDLRTSPAPAPGTPPAQSQENEQSFLRRNLYDTSLDQAADANRAVVRAGVTPFNSEACNKEAAKPAAQQNAQLISMCNDARDAAGRLVDKAKATAKEQDIMGDISRVSDLAAIGAIGTVGVTMFTRDASQASSLQNTAQLQRAAGVAAYASGATDVALGAYAFAKQRTQLKSLRNSLSRTETINGQQVGVQTSASTISALDTAIAKTTEASYKHAIMGAAKVGAGYMSMQLAQSNEKAAENLKSLQAAPPAAATVPPSQMAAGNGTVPTYTNNQPTFSIPNANGTSTTPVLGGGNTTSFSSGMGTSTMPTNGYRPPVAAANKTGGGVSEPGGGGGLTTGSSRAPSSGSEENNAAATETMGNSFELNLTGGGGPRYGGGGKSGGGGEDNAIGNLFSNLLGGNATTPGSTATGIRPNDLFSNDGSAYNGGDSLGANEGVSNSGSSVFELIKAKHTKMLQVGRLQGPGEVVSR